MLDNQEKTDFIVAVSDMVKTLNNRSQDVVVRRFGLKTGSTETLESIGKKYNITRERIRQIEEAALRELRKNFGQFKLSEYVNKVKVILQEYGNILREDKIFEEFTGERDFNKVNAALTLLMNVSSNFSRYPESDKFHAHWSLKDPVYVDKAYQTVDDVIREFKKINIVSDAELVDFFNKATQENTKEKKAILSYLSLSKLIDKNIFDQWGLVSRPEIKPKGVKDKAHLVMKQIGKPLHFREIANLINSFKFDSKKANLQTVHNELIKDSRFVLVGRGFYALAEWGYESGTVKEVLADLLKKYGPMGKEELVAKTTEMRFVRPNTILLNLHDKKLFKKDERGFYHLVKES